MSAVPDCILCDLPVHPHHHPETGKVCWTDGHNARPLEGRVCDACHPIALMLRFGAPNPGMESLRLAGAVRRHVFDAEASA
jgi:hypothetical protein